MFRSALFAALALAAAPALRADTVFLKNGNQMEGQVVREEPGQIELDIGYGTVWLQKDDIQRIKRAGAAGGKEAAELRRRRFESGREVPAGAEKLFELFHEVRVKREKAFDAKGARDESRREADGRETELPQLRQRYGAMMVQLRGVNPSYDPAGYNRLVGQINKTAAQIEAHQFSLGAGPQKSREAQAAIMDYLASYRKLREYLKGEGGAVLNGAKSKAADFYAWMNEAAREMEGDFAKDTVASERRGNHLMVDALINGKVTARLMVDTGAGTTLLYREAADRLGVAQGSADPIVQVTTADGALVPAKMITLDSIAVGESKVEKSAAAVVNASGQGFDGLLGMSFLSHFLVQVDAANGRLILEKLR